MTTSTASAAAAAHLLERVADLPPTRRPMPLFLDVDGVVNAYSRKHGEHHPADDWTYRRGFAVSANSGVQYTMHYAPDMVRVLNALIDAGQLEPYWLTTWWETANRDLLQLFDLHGPFQTLEDDRSDPSFFGWKRKHVMGLLSQDPSMAAIWIDDDIIQDTLSVHSARNHGSRLLTISPEGHFGITAAHLDAIIDWVAAHRVQ